MPARSSSSSAGEGDSSSTFWWRRWTEHSRSPSATTVAVRVGEELDLDVPRPLDVALAEDAVVAEGRLRLAPRGRERVLELGRLADDAHPAPAAAGRRLDEQREPELLRLALAHDRHACLAARCASPRSLSPPASSASAGGPTQTSPAASTASAKCGLSARKP